MTAYFVTASGTGVGKTYVTAALARAWRRRGVGVRVLKPVISGFTWNEIAETDTGLLLDAAGQPVDEPSVDAVSPWRFAAPLSPDMAAAREGRAVDFVELLDFCADAARDTSTALLIEGVGGVMVPLDDRHTVLDWMAALGLPVLLVTGSYLGTLSHTLTAVAAVEARGLEIAEVVVSESEDSPVPLAETLDTLARFLRGRAVAGIPRDGSGTAVAALAERLLRPDG